MLQNYFTHKEENETSEIEQNVENWGRNYSQCIFETEVFYTEPKCESHSYFRSFDHR